MSVEVPRESGSEVSAQRAARLPYETPTMEILLDSSVPYPRNPNFGVSSNIGRFEPIASVVDTYAADAQPRGLLDRTTARLGEIASRFAKPALVLETAVGGTAGAAVITIVQPDVPAAQANNGFLVEAGGTNPTAKCLDDPNIMIINREYADKITSGEITIAIGGPPITALEEGDKTAAIVPLTVTIEEAINNLLAPTPACEPKPIVKLPTAREEMEITINQDKKDIKSVSMRTLRRKTIAFWNKYKSELSLIHIIPSDEGPTLTKQDLLDILVKAEKAPYSHNERAKQIARVGYAGQAALIFLSIANKTTNPEIIAQAYILSDGMFDYGVTQVDPDHEAAKGAIINLMQATSSLYFQ